MKVLTSIILAVATTLTTMAVVPGAALAYHGWGGGYGCGHGWGHGSGWGRGYGWGGSPGWGGGFNRFAGWGGGYGGGGCGGYPYWGHHRHYHHRGWW